MLDHSSVAPNGHPRGVAAQLWGGTGVKRDRIRYDGEVRGQRTRGISFKSGWTEWLRT